MLHEQSLLLQKVTKQLEDTKLITDKLNQQNEVLNVHQQQAPINEVDIMKDVLVVVDRKACQEQRFRSSSSASTGKLSSGLIGQSDEVAQVASSSGQDRLRCLSMNNGHDHADARNQQSEIRATP